jgi:hypothetical protein
VAARTFKDSTGTVWEVFEVHRTSHNMQAVSAGLEKGWLAFVAGEMKRRLAPFPEEWRLAEDPELERLCGLARVAPPPRYPAGVLRQRAEMDGDARPVRVPRIRSARGDRPSTGAQAELPILETASSGDPVEQTVREFGRQARARGRPAIEAMVQLKALLGKIYPDAGSDARDIRRVRRWFVEAYYFERGS